MIQHAAEFRRCLIDLDIPGIRKLWQHVSPNLPQPKTDIEALKTLHIARTAASSVPDDLRRYSHDWLAERGMPSQLPNELLPASRRAESRIVEAVGISVRASSPIMQPVADAIHNAMQGAVLESYADGRTDPDFVRARMAEAGNTVRRKLVGTLKAK